MQQDKEWIIKCIETCINKWQLATCETLVNLFAKKHNTDDTDLLIMINEKETSFNV